MNKDRILEIADRIERQQGAKFDMAEWIDSHSCETSACIAGFTVMAYDPAYAAAWLGDRGVEQSISTVSAQLLDLDRARANKLFTPSGCIYLAKDNTRLATDDEIWEDKATPHNPMNATPQQAAKVLRHLAATGEVVWSVAFLQEPKA